MKKSYLLTTLFTLLIFSGCTAITPSPSNQTPKGYKQIKLDNLHLSLAVPSQWEMHYEKVHGDWHYFIGTITSFPGEEVDKAEIWDTFLNNTYKYHGVYLRTTHGSQKNFDIELKAKGNRFPTLYEKDLSTEDLLIKSVLRKNEHYGYYQFYAIGSKKKFKRGVIMETTSKMFNDEYDEMKFNDVADKKEIDTIINSIQTYHSF
jgi:hypothetical protein